MFSLCVPEIFRQHMPSSTTAFAVTKCASLRFFHHKGTKEMKQLIFSYVRPWELPDHRKSCLRVASLRILSKARSFTLAFPPMGSCVPETTLRSLREIFNAEIAEVSKISASQRFFTTKAQ